LTGTTDVGGGGVPLRPLDEKLHYCEEGVYILLTPRLTRGVSQL